MANSTNGGPSEGIAGAGSEPLAQLNVLAQYIKDFSFENPNAPGSFQGQPQPQIAIQINVNAQPLQGDDFEVELKMEGKAEAAGNILFAFDLSYAAVFRVRGLPQENLHPVIMIECPRLLFPFAREIIATAVRNGGYPPLLIEPVDFVGLYRQKMAQQQTQAPAADQA